MNARSVLLIAALAAGCAPSFDPASELKTLRVLGVQKDRPYARAGEEVTLSLLWHDASPTAPREVQRAWIGGCFNPPGDLYQGCFTSIAERPELVTFGDGDEFSLTIPEDIVRQRQPGQPDYGLSYVFFAACAGTLEPVLDSPEPGFPLRCLDAAGQPLGADDFVAGYTAIYSFEEFGNQNPIVTGFRFRGEDVAEDCIGSACIGMPIAPPDCSAPGAPCVPVCEDDGEPACSAYDVMPIVSQDSREPDEVSAASYGTDFEEQIWINYYVDRGSVSPGVKLVNDATKGWNAEQQAEFRPPKEPGPVTVWAVVHDNRGGTEFVRFTLYVQ